MIDIFTFTFNHRLFHMSNWNNYFWINTKIYLTNEQLQSLYDLSTLLFFTVKKISNYKSKVNVSIGNLNNLNDFDYLNRRTIRLCIKGIYSKIITEYSSYYVSIETENTYNLFIREIQYDQKNEYRDFKEWFYKKYPDRICPCISDYKLNG